MGGDAGDAKMNPLVDIKKSVFLRFHKFFNVILLRNFLIKQLSTRAIKFFHVQSALRWMGGGSGPQR